MAKRKPPKAGRPLIERTVHDENFAHTVKLVGACAAWAEEIREGHRLDFNDINLIHISAEIAIAYIKESAKDQGRVGEAARGALELLAAFRAARQTPAPLPNIYANSPPPHTPCDQEGERDERMR